MPPADVQAVLDYRLADITNCQGMFQRFEQEGMSEWPEGAKFVLGMGRAVAKAMETYINENRHTLAEESTAKTAVV